MAEMVEVMNQDMIGTMTASDMHVSTEGNHKMSVRSKLKQEGNYLQHSGRGATFQLMASLIKGRSVIRQLREASEN